MHMVCHQHPGMDSSILFAGIFSQPVQIYSKILGINKTVLAVVSTLNDMNCHIRGQDPW